MTIEVTIMVTIIYKVNHVSISKKGLRLDMLTIGSTQVWELHCGFPTSGLPALAEEKATAMLNDFWARRPKQ